MCMYERERVSERRREREREREKEKGVCIYASREVNIDKYVDIKYRYIDDRYKYRYR